VYIVRATLVTCVKDDTGLCSQSEVPVTSKYAQKILLILLMCAGFDGSLWQFGLSLRPGGATALAASGVPDQVIRQWAVGSPVITASAGVVNRLVQSKEDRAGFDESRGSSV